MHFIVLFYKFILVYAYFILFYLFHRVLNLTKYENWAAVKERLRATVRSYHYVNTIKQSYFYIWFLFVQIARSFNISTLNQYWSFRGRYFAAVSRSSAKRAANFSLEAGAQRSVVAYHGI